MLAKLTTMLRDGRERMHPILDDRVYILGRGERVDIRVTDGSASRSHCIVEKKGEAFTLFDLTSANGTLLNGERIQETKPLRPGDVIQIGETKIYFHTLADNERWALLTEIPEEGEFDPLGPAKRFIGWRDPATTPPDSGVISMPGSVGHDTMGCDPSADSEIRPTSSVTGTGVRKKIEIDLDSLPVAPKPQAPPTVLPASAAKIAEPPLPPLDPEEEEVAQHVLQMKYLTEDKLLLARRQREMEAPEKPLGMYLVDRKLLNWDQLKDLLAKQQSSFAREAEKRWTKRENVLFGKMAVKKDFITQEQLDEALAEQSKTKPKINIGEMLIKKGFMTKNQVMVVLRAQQQEVLRCTGCDAAYLTHNLQAGRRLKCKTCGAILTVPGEPVDPRTLEGVEVPDDLT